MARITICLIWLIPSLLFGQDTLFIQNSVLTGPDLDKRVLEKVDYTHYQDSVDTHNVWTDVRHDGDSLSVKYVGCGVVQYTTWHSEGCNEVIELIVKSIDYDSTITRTEIHREQIDLGLYNSLWLKSMAVNGSNYFEVTIDNTQVASDLTDFPVYVDLSDLGSTHGFWTNVASDGSDIRVTKSDGTTEVPFELVSIDTANNTGELHFKASGTLSSTSDTIFRVYYNSSDSAYAATATYGRNNVWSDYEIVYHMNQDPSGTAPQIVNSTGNGDGTTNGSMTSGDLVSGKIGDNLNFDGSNDYIAANIGSGTDIADIDFTMQAWGYLETKGGDRDIISKGDGDNSTPELRYDAGDDYWEFNLNDGSYKYAKYSQEAASTGSYVKLDGVRDGSTIYIYKDGTQGATTATVGSVIDGTFDFIVGALNPGTLDRFWDGDIDEVRARYSALSSDWISAEHTNQNTTTTFYTLSAEQSTGSVTLSGDSLSTSSLLDQGTLTITMTGNGLLSSPTLDQGTIPITLTGNALSSGITLDQATLQTISLIANDLSVSPSLDQGSIVGAVVLTGDDLAVGSRLDQGEVTFTLSGDDLRSIPSLDTGQLVIILDGNDLTADSTLDQSSIQTITLDGNDLTASSALGQGSLIIIGDATKVSLEADELYTITLSVSKLYSIELSEKELYTITLNADEVIENG